MEIKNKEKDIVNFGDILQGQVFRSPGIGADACVDSDLFMKIEQWDKEQLVNTVRIKDGKTYALLDHGKCVPVDGYFKEE